VISRRALALIGVIVILGLSAGVRFWALGTPPGYIFDEVYYPHDAKALIDGKIGPKDATLSWEPGKEISWPHPEYGKMAIALGILAFGDNAFGWRFMSALAGLAILCMVYPIARRMGLNRGWSLAALALAATDMLGIAQSRIGTLDIFIAVFTVACIYLTLRYVQDGHRWYWLVLAGLAGGLAFGTKWSGAFACLVALVLVFIFRTREPFGGLDEAERTHAELTQTVSEKRAALTSGAPWATAVYDAADDHDGTIELPRSAPVEASLSAPVGLSRPAPAAPPVALASSAGPRPSFAKRAPRLALRALPPLLLLVILPIGLYVASYGFYFAAGHTWSQWIELQRQALIFNLHLSQPHTYASKPPTWILDVRPVWYYFQGKAQYHGIVALGNPVLWWGATLSLLALPIMALIDRDRRLVMPVLVVALLYFPWFSATRTSFLYYMTPVAPFMAVMVATALQRLTGRRQHWPRLRPSDEPLRDLRDEGRDYTALVAFAAVFLVTAFFWQPIGHGIAYLFWRLPERSSVPFAYIITATVLLLGAALLAWLLARVHSVAVWRPLGWAYVGLAAGVCVAFLPIIIDLGVSPAHYYQLMWLPSWI
jgi:dolichyl-phosphate-mannose-protein mannosyltransferase